MDFRLSQGHAHRSLLWTLRAQYGFLGTHLQLGRIRSILAFKTMRVVRRSSPFCKWPLNKSRANSFRMIWEWDLYGCCYPLGVGENLRSLVVEIQLQIWSQTSLHKKNRGADQPALASLRSSRSYGEPCFNLVESLKIGTVAFYVFMLFPIVFVGRLLSVYYGPQ